MLSSVNDDLLMFFAELSRNKRRFDELRPGTFDVDNIFIKTNPWGTSCPTRKN
ncbi:hypothetical protein [Syntrophaceticus schinkii]|uniref:hypothetical protein n=1 Tax=Syntrophaceticus schinkii TaxID=499207 RepID=UPI0018DDC9E2|nr:hypothetical protein [Syntrophaceticus schinkii]